ncbi:MAG: sigma factor-like helix-turn-helix DNA-binding protein [Novosphingobium sp.]
MKLSPHWALFARVQRAADHRQISNRYWAADDAADAALSLITATPPTSIPDIAGKVQVLLGNRIAKHRRRAISLADHMRSHGTPILVPGVDLQVEARSEIDRIRGAVTPVDWQILEMAAMGETQADIAAELGLAEGTVKNRLSRLRKLLVH